MLKAALCGGYVNFGVFSLYGDDALEKALKTFVELLSSIPHNNLLVRRLLIFVLLRFSQACELLSSKAAFTIAFFAAVNHNYDHKQRTLKHRNTQNGSKSTNHKSETMTF